MIKLHHQSHMSIHKKFILYFTILLAIPILILGFYTYQQSKKNSEYQCVLTIENNLDSIIVEMQARAEREVTYIKYLAYNQNFRKLLEEKDINRSSIAMELNRSVEPILWYYITSDSYVKDIQILSDRIEESIGHFLVPLDEVSDYQWYTDGESNYSTVWIYQNDELFLTRSILDTATVSSRIAVMKMNLYPLTFMEPFEQFQYLNNGLLVVDGSGQIVYSHKTGNDSIDEAVLKLVNSTEINDTSEYIIRSAIIPSINWTVYYFVDRALILQLLHEITIRTIQIVGVVILIAMIVLSLFSHSLSKRILILKDAADRVSSGDFETPISSKDTDEIGVVINSFGEMTARLNHTINAIYKVQLEKREIEQKALQAQINRHFLYNILSSIKWKAIRQGNDDISDIVGYLAVFYRTALNNGNQVTKVGSEIENIRAYISLQKMIHEIPFKVEYRIEEGALELQMLNFILQPIVENAFKHGIDYSDTRRDGHIIVQCWTDDKFLYFAVKNNGPSMSSDTLQNLLTKPGSGYGIFNIQERIHLYYGLDCGLEVALDAEGYTVFTIKIRKSVQE